MHHNNESSISFFLCFGGLRRLSGIVRAAGGDPIPNRARNLTSFTTRERCCFFFGGIRTYSKKTYHISVRGSRGGLVIRFVFLGVAPQLGLVNGMIEGNLLLVRLRQRVDYNGTSEGIRVDSGFFRVEKILRKLSPRGKPILSWLVAINRGFDCKRMTPRASCHSHLSRNHVPHIRVPRDR